MSVGRICVRSTDVTFDTESAQVVARRMLDRNVGSLVVVNERQEPVGIVTDRDLAVRVLAPGKDGATTSVGDVMTSNPRVVTEDMAIEDVLRIMRSGPYRRVPVVDANGRLVGLVTLDDVLDLLSEELNSIGTLLHKESPEFAAAAT